MVSTNQHPATGAILEGIGFGADKPGFGSVLLRGVTLRKGAHVVPIHIHEWRDEGHGSSV